MSLHAFVDESKRRSVYLLALVLVKPTDLARLRKILRTFVMPGQSEVHFAKEGDRRRRKLADQIGALDGPVVRIYRGNCSDSDEAARQRCLARMTDDLIELGVERLMLDTRGTADHYDHKTFSDAKHRKNRRFEFFHVKSGSEPLIWIADVVTWCVGAGGDWLRRVETLIEKVLTLDPA